MAALLFMSALSCAQMASEHNANRLISSQAKSWWELRSSIASRRRRFAA